MGSSLSSARSRADAPLRRGSETPRVFTPPLRKLTEETTAGYSFIEFCEEVVGTELLPWQRWLAIHALELLPDGTFRFRTVVLLVARQNGKSTFMQLLALFFMYVRGARLTIGTAQNLDIAEEVWQGAVDIAEDVPELADEIARIDKVNGKKALELRTGERYKVQAANRRGGRGLSGDLVLMDELREHQSWDAWGAVTKTTLARKYAQIWAASNAGDAASIVLRFLRKMAHLALGDPDGLRDVGDAAPDDEEISEDLEEDSLGVFEWSAAPGSAIDDRDAWAQANPSLGHTITERAIAASLRTDPEWVFRTEVLCQWTDGTLEGPFPPGTWDRGRVEVGQSGIVGQVTACVDMSHDRTRTHIAYVGRNADGTPHGEIVASRAGQDWVLPWLSEPHRRERVQAITGQTRGAPVSGLMEELATAGLPVEPWQGPDLAAACGYLYDVVRDTDGPPGLLHLPQPVLDVAAATAVSRPLGDAWVWDRKKSPTDIAPLVALTGALWLMTRPVEKPSVSVYESRGVEVI